MKGRYEAALSHFGDGQSSQSSFSCTQVKQKTKNYDRDVNREIDYNHRDLHGRREDVVGLPFLEGLL